MKIAQQCIGYTGTFCVLLMQVERQFILLTTNWCNIMTDEYYEYYSASL